MILSLGLFLSLLAACPESQRIAVHEPSFRQHDGTVRWTGRGAWVQVDGDTLRLCQCGKP